MSEMAGKTVRSALQLSKAAMRSEVTAALAKAMTTTECKIQTGKVVDKLIELDSFKNAKSLCVYLSMGVTEVDTRPILAAAFAAGKKCFAPRCESKTAMNMYQVFDEKEIDSFPKTKWNIPEPPKESKREDALDCEDLALIVVPGVAFDSSGRRLGHGAGYYDRYIARMQEARKARNWPMPALVGVALSPQIVKEVPVGDSDRILDAVLSP